MPRGVVFVFAHQDDEIAAASHILDEVHGGTAVHCVYLTDGGAAHAIRDLEAAAALQLLGVSRERIHFIGSVQRIPDGTLVEHLDRALSALESAMATADLDAVYTLAWQGGHQDHDAAHLVACAFAGARGLIAECREFPLYDGEGTAGPFFRTMAPSSGGRWERRRIAMRDALLILRLPWLHRSQRRSWLGLYPGLIGKVGLLRRQLSRPVDPSRFRQPPHRGRLFYERRFRFPYDRFQREAQRFIDTHFRAQ